MCFSFLKKKEKHPDPKTQPVDWRLYQSNNSLDITRKAIPKNYANESYEYVTRNSNSAIRRIIIRHALLLRSKKNIAVAIKELETASEFLDHIENAIAKADAKGLIVPPNEEGVHESNYIFVSNLLYAYLVSLLSNDWARAKRIAELSKLPIFLDADGGHKESMDGESYDDLITRMFSAVILDNQDGFKQLHQRYHHNIVVKDYFFEKYFNYDQMMALIMARDEAGFNQCLPVQEQNYLSRKTDNKTESYDAIYGCYDDNGLVYDVWATALCNLAQYKGINVNYFSEIIPINNTGKIGIQGGSQLDF